MPFCRGELHPLLQNGNMDPHEAKNIIQTLHPRNPHLSKISNQYQKCPLPQNQLPTAHRKLPAVPRM